MVDASLSTVVVVVVGLRRGQRLFECVQRRGVDDAGLLDPEVTLHFVIAAPSSSDHLPSIGPSQ